MLLFDSNSLYGYIIAIHYWSMSDCWCLAFSLLCWNINWMNTTFTDCLVFKGYTLPRKIYPIKFLNLNAKKANGMSELVRLIVENLTWQRACNWTHSVTKFKYRLSNVTDNRGLNLRVVYISPRNFHPSLPRRKSTSLEGTRRNSTGFGFGQPYKLYVQSLFFILRKNGLLDTLFENKMQWSTQSEYIIFFSLGWKYLTLVDLELSLMFVFLFEHLPLWLTVCFNAIEMDTISNFNSVHTKNSKKKILENIRETLRNLNNSH